MLKKIKVHTISKSTKKNPIFREAYKKKTEKMKQPIMIKLHKHENEAKEDSERKITNDDQ